MQFLGDLQYRKIRRLEAMLGDDDDSFIDPLLRSAAGRVSYDCREILRRDTEFVCIERYLAIGFDMQQQQVEETTCKMFGAGDGLDVSIGAAAFDR